MSVELNLTVKGVAALTRVAEWLEAGAPHVAASKDRTIDGFDMEYGVNEKDGCGTACCIAGAVYQFERLQGAFNPSDFFAEVQPEAIKFLLVDPEDEGQVDELKKLFLPWDYFGYDSIEEFSEHGRAAKVVRNVLATGTVDWDIES